MRNIKVGRSFIRHGLRRRYRRRRHNYNNLIDSNDIKTAQFVAKEEGVVAGLQVAEMVFRKFDNNLEWEVFMPDGTHVVPGDIIAQFKGNYRALLTGERKALNFLQRLSGIASYSNLCMKETEGTKVEILDTRKTLPGYRYLDKYAVRMEVPRTTVLDCTTW